MLCKFVNLEKYKFGLWKYNVMKNKINKKIKFLIIFRVLTLCAHSQKVDISYKNKKIK